MATASYPANWSQGSPHLPPGCVDSGPYEGNTDDLDDVGALIWNASQRAYHGTADRKGWNRVLELDAEIEGQDEHKAVATLTLKCRVGFVRGSKVEKARELLAELKLLVAEIEGEVIALS